MFRIKVIAVVGFFVLLLLIVFENSWFALIVGIVFFLPLNRLYVDADGKRLLRLLLRRNQRLLGLLALGRLGPVGDRFEICQFILFLLATFGLDVWIVS